MRSQSASDHGYRFPPDIISHAVWLYYRFCLSFRDAEDLLAQRGVTVTYETIRQWCQRFGPVYARQLRRRRGRMGDTWHLDEMFVTIQGRQQYLWRAVDEDGDVLVILVQALRNRRAAVRPGSPWENGYVESFNGKLRDELLDREIFYTLTEAQILIERWRREYNTVRPHSALGYQPPAPEAISPAPLSNMMMSPALS